MAADRRTASVAELQHEGVLLVEDGNHGEYRPRPDEFVENGVAFIRAADMDGGRVLFERASKINAIARQRITKGIGAGGDVLLSHKGTVGKVALVPGDPPPFVCSPQTTFWRTLDQDSLDRGYLHAFLRSPAFHAQLATRAGETDMAPYVSLTSQRGLSVVLPPIEDQRAIAGILGALDDKIELNRRVSETLEAMARAIFQSWFVDFDPVRAKAEGRQPAGMDAETAALFPACFYADGFPEGWQEAPLGNVTNVLSRGLAPTYVEEGGILVLNQRCVRAHAVIFSFARRHDEKERSVAGREICIGDVLVNSTGVGTLGRAAPVTWLPERAIADGHLSIIRAARDKISATLLGWTLITREGDLEALAEGTTGQTELARERLRAFSITLPPPQVSLAFERLVEPMDSRRSSNERESLVLEALRDALLPGLISGKIRVGHAEKAGLHATR